MLGRRTQVVKGEVCKTSMQRFESARRLHFPFDIVTGSQPSCSPSVRKASGFDPIMRPFSTLREWMPVAMMIHDPPVKLAPGKHHPSLTNAARSMLCQTAHARLPCDLCGYCQLML